MDCLSTEQIVRYLRGNGAEPRALEGHVLDCPGCAMELLLAREALRDVKVPVRRVVVRRRTSWIPWIAAVAAAVLLAMLPFFRQPPPAPAPLEIAKPTPPVLPALPPLKPEPPPAPRPEPSPPPSSTTPPAPVPELKPAPEPPKPEPRPEPKPPPPKPAPTVVERAVVARVVQAVGSTPGRVVLAGDVVNSGRQEFLALAVEGVGPLYLRDNSRLEIGAGGEIDLHSGELLLCVDAGRKIGRLGTPAGDVDLNAPQVGVRVSKEQTDVWVPAGRASLGATAVEGPASIRAKAGKAAETGLLEAGFAGWIPEKLASRRFTGWFEAEAGTAAGFRAAEMELASGGRAMQQVEDRAAFQLKAPLPAKGKHVLWLRVRQYPGKALGLALSVNGQALPEIRFEGQEERPWRWIGPVAFTSDRADLAVAALTRRAIPVVVDLAVVSSDPKFVPPERLGDRRAYDLILDEPAK